MGAHASGVKPRSFADFTSLGLLAALHALSTLNFWWLLAGLAVGYAFAWGGHFFFENNRPAMLTSRIAP
jgi:hypothetical protein